MKDLFHILPQQTRKGLKSYQKFDDYQTIYIRSQGEFINSLKLDIRLALTLATIMAALGGFYYTTQLRLDRLEETIEEIQEVKKEVYAVKKELVRLSRKVNKVRKTKENETN